jgi:phage portal protein BeeE
VQDSSMNLYEKTVDLLASTKKTKKDIAENCGVSYRWLFNLAHQKSEDLSVTKVQRVYDYLSQEDLRQVS